MPATRRTTESTKRRSTIVARETPANPAISFNVDELEAEGGVLDPVTPLNRLVWKLQLKEGAKLRSTVRRLPRRTVMALGEQGIVQLQHMAGIRASELKMLPGVGEIFMKHLVRAAQLAGVEVITDIDRDGESLSVGFSGTLVKAAREFCGAYLNVSPQDLLRNAIMEHEESIVRTMFERTQDIRNGELDRIHAQIEALQKQAQQIAQTRIDTLLAQTNL